MFDAVGTLLHPDPTAPEVYVHYARRFGAEVDPAIVQRRFSEAMKITWGPETSESAERARWQAVVQHVFRELPDAGGELFESLWEHFANAKHWRVAYELEDLWSKLTQLRIQIGIASNFDQRLIQVCGGCPPLDQCKSIYCSASLGYAKPHPAFFEAIERRTGWQPHELLMVGDDWEKDCLGATQRGWRTVWIDRRESFKPGLERRGIHRIQDLSELVPLLAESGVDGRS